MRGFLCTATFLLLGSLSGCGGAELFEQHGLAESPETAAAPWPRLVDTPEAPPPGEFGPGVPDPVTGAAAAAALVLAAEEAAARAETLSAPVLSEDELRRLGR